MATSICILKAKRTAADNIQFSRLSGGRFYTLTSATNPADELLFTRLGANDPEFNLRRDPALMIRGKIPGIRFCVRHRTTWRL